MHPRTASAVLFALCLACAGRGAGLAYGSADDVGAILRGGGVEPAPMSCVNTAYAGGVVTRGVACTLTLAPADVDALLARVPLVVGDPRPYGEVGNCEATPGLRARDPGVEVYVGQNTRVPNGVGHVELHVVRATGAACVEIHYPWG